MRRKSASEKKLMGTYRPDRDRSSVRFATANGVAIKAPPFVRKNKTANAEWKNVIPHLLSEGILKQTDLGLLANYCTLYARWRAAAEDVEKNGQIVTVTSTTRTGKTEKPIANPAVRNEILYSAALARVGTKFGLNPLDRPRVEAPEADDETGPDPFQRFLDEGNDDPELDYIFKPASN